MGDDILPADIARHAHDIRSDTMGILVVAQVGRRMGEMADTLSDGAFLRSHALFRWFLRAVAIRHRAVHTGGEPDGHHRQ